MELREAAYEVCPVVQCKTHFIDKTGAKWDVNNCIPALNQRNKWVFWNAPQMLHLDRTYAGSKGSGTTIARGNDEQRRTDWRDGLKEQLETERDVGKSEVAASVLAQKDTHGLSRISLDMDARAARGKETMTYSNLAPGMYRIVVTNFENDAESPTGNGLQPIHAAKPIVNINIGNDITVSCQIDMDSCGRNEFIKVWNVGFIKVTAPSSKSDTLYRISVHTATREKHRLQYRELATFDRIERPDVSDGHGSYWSRPKVVWKNGHDAAENDAYNSMYNNNLGLQKMSCLSRCEVKSGTKECLVHEKQSPATLEWLGYDH